MKLWISEIDIEADGARKIADVWVYRRNGMHLEQHDYLEVSHSSLKRAQRAQEKLIIKRGGKDIGIGG